jgi:hypothetical protein
MQGAGRRKTIAAMNDAVWFDPTGKRRDAKARTPVFQQVQVKHFSVK